MKPSPLAVIAAAFVAVASSWTTAQAQQVCGGLVGIPCDEGQFCELPDGYCCCDFFGVCADVPDACPRVCDPVCGCDGVTHANRCEASVLGISVAHTGSCDPVEPAVTLRGFGSSQRLFWDPNPGVPAYNVYIKERDFAPTTFNGRCLYAAVPEDSVLLQGDPDSDEAWMFQVTALFPEGEGSMGLTSECHPRTPAAPCTCTLPPEVGPCDATIPRWFHNYSTNRCEEFVWGGCGGNANKFETVAECEAECRDICAQPAVHGECTAAVLQWYFNVLSGHCEKFVWGGCDGNENRFATEEECRTACGDICFLPPEVGDCDGVCPRWFFNPGTGQCETFIWGCCGGNANNFATEAECRAECAPG
jgi:hypothetical protein